MNDDLRINDALTLPAACLAWRAVRASGPGGQAVNKLATKVRLVFYLRGCNELTSAQKQRMRANPRVRMDADGNVVLESQKTRSQLQNVADVRSRLAELIADALVPPKPRKKTKPTRASKERRLSAKRQVSEKKKQRRSATSNYD